MAIESVGYRPVFPPASARGAVLDEEKERTSSPECIPAGWQPDLTRLQDPKILPLVSLGYLPVQPINGGVQPIDWAQRYQENFGKEEIVFLWENRSYQVLTLLYCDFGRDVNEISDNPDYIQSRVWQSDDQRYLTSKDEMQMQATFNYFFLLNDLRDRGIMPEEWTWKHKIEKWKANGAPEKDKATPLKEFPDPVKDFLKKIFPLETSS